jgi:hypothetical protein
MAIQESTPKSPVGQPPLHKVALPNQKTAMIAASIQLERPTRYLCPEPFRFINQPQYRTFGTAPESTSGNQIALMALNVVCAKGASDLSQRCCEGDSEIHEGCQKAAQNREQQSLRCPYFAMKSTACSVPLVFFQRQHRAPHPIGPKHLRPRLHTLLRS